MPDVVIRTTLSQASPAKAKEFETLAEFVKDMRFDRLGCFPVYSPQEGTPAYSFENQVDEQTKVDRGENIMELQRTIVDEKTKSSWAELSRFSSKDMTDILTAIWAEAIWMPLKLTQSYILLLGKLL